MRAYRVHFGYATFSTTGTHLASYVRDMAATPTTPPRGPQPMAITPPRMRARTFVEAGVTFANAISNTLIWQVEERVPIGAAIREISKRTGADISKIKFLNDRGPVSFKENIDENVAVLLLSE